MIKKIFLLINLYTFCTIASNETLKIKIKEGKVPLSPKTENIFQSTKKKLEEKISTKKIPLLPSGTQNIKLINQIRKSYIRSHAQKALNFFYNRFTDQKNTFCIIDETEETIYQFEKITKIKQYIKTIKQKQ
jgi:hypothetical protein